MKNIGEILKAAGASVRRTSCERTVFLTDINDFAAMNEVYGSYFAAPAPARATVQVAGLPKNARVEIDVIAARRLGRTIWRARSTASTPSTLRSDLITFSRCFMSLISTVMLIRPRWSSCVVASTLVMFVLMSAIFELTSARMPFRSSTWMLSRTV